MSKSCSAAAIVSQFVVDDALLEDETNETWPLVLNLGEGHFKHFTKKPG